MQPPRQMLRVDMLCDIAQRQCKNLFELAQADSWDEFEEQLGPIFRKIIAKDLSEEENDVVADVYKTELGTAPEGWSDD